MLEKVLVFGAGYNFLKYVNQIQSKYDVVALTDNDEQKWGREIGGFICQSPADAMRSEYDCVLIASDAGQIVKEIEKQLGALGNQKKLLKLNQCIILDFSWQNSEYPSCYKDDFGNEIIVDEGVYFNRIHFYITGCNNRIILHKDVMVVVNLDIYVGGSGNTIEIGKGTLLVSSHIDVAEKGVVRIGDGCMLSADVDIYQNAAHPIFDINNGKRLNPSRDIIIGSHVWIGKRVGLMSGFRIGDGSIVGYGSVSSGVFGNNVTIAGNPATLLRENIEWRRDGLGYYEINSIEESKINK